MLPCCSAMDTAGVMYVLLLSEAARGIVLPSLTEGILESGGSLATVAYAIALFSLGRLVATLPLAYLAEWQSTRASVIAACATSVVGHVLYANFAGVSDAQTIVLVSRFLIGVGTGTVGTCRGFVAHSSMADRTRLMAIAGLAQSAGFALSPSVALVFPGGLALPGICMALANLAAVMGAAVWMPSSDPVSSESNDSVSRALSSSEEKRAIALFMVLNVVLRGVLADAEALVPAERRIVFDGDGTRDQVVAAARFFFVLGVFGCICFALIDPVVKRTRISERALFVAGVALVGVGQVFLMDEVHGASTKLFTAGAVLVWCVGSPITTTFSVSLFSKALGSKPQAVLLSWITVAGSIGRIAFPLAGVRMPGVAMWGANAALCALCAGLIACFVPPSSSSSSSRKPRRAAVSSTRYGAVDEAGSALLNHSPSP